MVRSIAGWPYKKIVVGITLISTPVIAYFLIAGALTADYGPLGSLLMIFVPLLMLGVGLYLMVTN